MEHGERKDEQQLNGALTARKNGPLNKFLTKTYHMIDTCNPDIATWADEGQSFVIKDVKEFSMTVLPRFFKHSKFPSFVRQLNFYSFRKLRPPPDAPPGTNHKSVRFAHDFFREGQPELLYRIQRTSKPLEVSSTEVRSLKEEIHEVSDEIDACRQRMAGRFQTMITRAELDYQRHMASVTLSFQRLSQLALELKRPKFATIKVEGTKELRQPPPQILTSPPTSPSPPPAATWKQLDIPEKPVSPTCVTNVETLAAISWPGPSAEFSPLMALSMIASMDHEKEFGSR